MKLETRLEQMKRYLNKAEIDPVGNALYIEDLKLSIDFCERQLKRVNKNKVEVMSGFEVDS